MTTRTPIDEFMKHVFTAFPLAEIGEDNDGQLIIYTGLTEVRDGDMLYAEVMADGE